MEIKEKMSNLIKELRDYKVSAPPEHPVHPEICDEAAYILECLLDALEEWSN